MSLNNSFAHPSCGQHVVPLIEINGRMDRELLTLWFNDYMNIMFWGRLLPALANIAQRVRQFHPFQRAFDIRHWIVLEDVQDRIPRRAEGYVDFPEVEFICCELLETWMLLISDLFFEIADSHFLRNVHWKYPLRRVSVR